MKDLTELTQSNYEVVFHVPSYLRHDTYIVDCGNFTESFDILFSEYENSGVTFSVTIKPTKVQVFHL